MKLRIVPSSVDVQMISMSPDGEQRDGGIRPSAHAIKYGAYPIVSFPDDAYQAFYLGVQRDENGNPAAACYKLFFWGTSGYFK